VSTILPNFPLWFYIPAALLAAVGLIGHYCSLFKGRHKGRLRCPKCWYDMQGTTLPATCPECGHTAATKADLQRTRRHWWHALAALLLILPLAVVFARLHAAKVYYAVMPKWKLAEEVSGNGTTISRYRVRNPDDWGERVVVTSKGKQVLASDDYAVSLSGYNHSRPTFIDADNNGVQEAVIECYSGGAHCCYRVYIIELRESGAVIVADIDARNGMGVEAPTAAGGEWVFNIPDQSFDYWKVSHAESPMPAVYYRLNGGALRIALDRHDKPAFSAGELDSAARNSHDAMGAQDATADRAAVWRAAIERLYAGHEDQAWTILDRAWAGPPADKSAFIAEFKDVLAEDPWYQDLLAARAARAAGKPIPPSAVGMSGRAGADEAEAR